MNQEWERKRSNSSSSSGGEKIKEIEVEFKPRINMIRLVEEVPEEPEDPKTLEPHEDPTEPTEEYLKRWKSEIEESMIQEGRKNYSKQQKVKNPGNQEEKILQFKMD